MSSATLTPSAPRFGAPLLVMAGLVSQELGAAIAVLLFPAVGAAAMVTLRLVFSALLLLAVCRPRLRGRSARDWLTAAALGAALGGMNLTFYFSLSRLPLGTAVTVEVMGPLLLSVACARKAASWLWAFLGVAGVLLLGGSDLGALEPAGVAFAATASVLWACYILLSARAAAAFAKLDGLAIAMAVAAAVTLPFGAASTGAVLLRPDVILLGLAVAVLSSTAPYALEMSALRRLPASAFAVLMALAPAMAALVGALVLGQHLSVLSWLAVGLVVAASMGAVLFAGDRRGNGRKSDGGVNAVPSPDDAGTHVST